MQSELQPRLAQAVTRQNSAAGDERAVIIGGVQPAVQTVAMATADVSPPGDERSFTIGYGIPLIESLKHYIY